MSLLLTSCTMDKQPDRLLHKGPDYFRTRTNPGLFAKPGKSAVELLAASKSQFYSSRSCLDLHKQQDLAVSLQQQDRLVKTSSKKTTPSRSRSEYDLSLIQQTQVEDESDENNNDISHDTNSSSSSNSEQDETQSSRPTSQLPSGDLLEDVADQNSSVSPLNSNRGAPGKTFISTFQIPALISSDEDLQNVNRESPVPEDETDGKSVKKPIPLPRKSKVKPPVPPRRISSTSSPVPDITNPRSGLVEISISYSKSDPSSFKHRGKPVTGHTCGTPEADTKIINKEKDTLINCSPDFINAENGNLLLESSSTQQLKEVIKSHSFTVVESTNTYKARPVFITNRHLNKPALPPKPLDVRLKNRDIKGTESAPESEKRETNLATETEFFGGTPAENPLVAGSKNATFVKIDHHSISKPEMSMESVDQAVYQSEISALPVVAMEGSSSDLPELELSLREITRSNSSLSGRLDQQQSSSPLSASPTTYCASVPRSYSDISCQLEGQHSRDSSAVSSHSRLSQTSIGTDLENFFNQMGLDRGVLEPIERLKDLQATDVFDSMSSLDSFDAASVCSTYSRSEQEWSDSQAVERGQQQTSVVERNARIIKWLCNVRRAKSQSQKHEGAPASAPAAACNA